MTYDEQESNLRQAAEVGILALKQRANEVRIMAQKAHAEGNTGWAEALMLDAQSIDREVAEIETAYRLKFPVKP